MRPQMYNATECKLHANCSLCTNAFVGVPVCFELKIAKKLPPQIFKCDLPPEPPSAKATATAAGDGEPAELTEPALLSAAVAGGASLPEKAFDPCTGFNATECAAHAANCSLCGILFSKKQLCFSYNTTAKLPPREPGLVEPCWGTT